MARFAEQLERFFYDPDEALPEGLELPEPRALAPLRETTPEEYLGFLLGTEWYAVRVPGIREVGRVPRLTEVPRAPAALLGVMNLRGEVIPVYDLKPRLRLAAAPAAVAGPGAPRTLLPSTARVIVLRSARGDAAVLVDSVLDVIRLRPSEIEPAPRGTGERDGILGLGRKADRLFILLDLEGLLP